MLNPVYKLNKGTVITLDSRKTTRPNLIPSSLNLPNDYKFQFSPGEIIPEYILLAANYDVSLLVQKRALTPMGVKEINSKFKADNTKLVFILTSIGKQTQPDFIENAVDPFNPDVYWPSTFLLVSDDGARNWKAIKRIDAGVLS